MACSPYYASNSSWLSLCMAASYKLQNEEEIYFEKRDASTDESGANANVANLLCFEKLDKECSMAPCSVKLTSTVKVLSPAKRASRKVNRNFSYVLGIPAASKRDSAWNIMFRRLQEYKHEHGHCNVPQGYTYDPELAIWVKNQRQAYRYMLEKKTTKRISPDRVTRLNHIGFEWRKYARAEEWKSPRKLQSGRSAPSTKTDIPIDNRIRGDELVCDEAL
eukprot:CAMPEP_0178925986 /NCGR_PEP_ID=MMETSP0786-20121207/18249_1 /TAXON_ID=186022 /ORGANISM="Thalassionema frauenfeldii, Strain CCMP 1798" /LENGTH=219 /DNA_ID=CAMNT_0020600993 /DNA_START=51 /DNA_END=710 /DNA_ORIENTATION=-